MLPAPIPPQVIWLTGLPAAGKTTIATELARQLRQLEQPCWVLDGDQLRNGVNADLGYSPTDRAESVRRVSYIARILVDARLVAIVALVSPFRADRRAARRLFAPDEFLEVWVETPLEVCEHRDPKGLYAKARAGKVAWFTGIGQIYEPPTSPDLVLTGTAPVTESVDRLVAAALGPRSSTAVPAVDPHLRSS